MTNQPHAMLLLISIAKILISVLRTGIQSVPKKSIPFEIKPLLEFECIITMLNPRVRKKVYLLKSSLCLNLNALLLCSTKLNIIEFCED